MKKGKILVVGLIALLTAYGLVLAGCDIGGNGGGNNTGNTGNTGNGTVNLQNQHGSDTIYWFEMKNDGMVTIGEAVEIKPYFSKQFQVPAGTYIAGVTAGGAQDLRTCIVNISGGQIVTLVFNGRLSQQ
jgi:hypothetical protein